RRSAEGSCVRGRPGTRPSRSLSALLDQLRHQAGPARLMAGAEPGAVVAVEVFVEGDQVLPVMVLVELVGAAKNCPAAVQIAREDVDQPAREFRGHFP